MSGDSSDVVSISTRRAALRELAQQYLAGQDSGLAESARALLSELDRREAAERGDRR